MDQREDRWMHTPCWYKTGRHRDLDEGRRWSREQENTLEIRQEECTGGMLENSHLEKH